jgi:tRNA(Arg) A34 adenosine deaminase TadA
MLLGNIAIMKDERAMELAILTALEGVGKGNSPFGAVVSKKGRVVASAHNTVLTATDSTAHAEINAIRAACKKLGAIDLSDCTIYSTCEPCPMCFSAIHWARIGRVVYGASIKDAKKYGFHELEISDKAMEYAGHLKIRLVPDFMRTECLRLFETWGKTPKKKTY